MRFSASRIEWGLCRSSWKVLQARRSQDQRSARISAAPAVSAGRTSPRSCQFALYGEHASLSPLPWVDLPSLSHPEVSRLLEREQICLLPVTRNPPSSPPVLQRYLLMHCHAMLLSPPWEVAGFARGFPSRVAQQARHGRRLSLHLPLRLLRPACQWSRQPGFL